MYADSECAQQPQAMVGQERDLDTGVSLAVFLKIPTGMGFQARVLR
jgi:hypothetical protein